MSRFGLQASVLQAQALPLQGAEYCGSPVSVSFARSLPESLPQRLFSEVPVVSAALLPRASRAAEPPKAFPISASVLAVPCKVLLRGLVSVLAVEQSTPHRRIAA